MHYALHPAIFGAYITANGFSFLFFFFFFLAHLGRLLFVSIIGKTTLKKTNFEDFFFFSFSFHFSLQLNVFIASVSRAKLAYFFLPFAATVAASRRIFIVFFLSRFLPALWNWNVFYTTTTRVSAIRNTRIRHEKKIIWIGFQFEDVFLMIKGKQTSYKTRAVHFICARREWWSKVRRKIEIKAVRYFSSFFLVVEGNGGVCGTIAMYGRMPTKERKKTENDDCKFGFK